MKVSVKVRKPKLVNFRLTQDEYKMLQELKDYYGESMSNILRSMLYDKYFQAFNA